MPVSQMDLRSVTTKFTPGGEKTVALSMYPESAVLSGGERRSMPHVFDNGHRPPHFLFSSTVEDERTWRINVSIACDGIKETFLGGVSVVPAELADDVFDYDFAPQGRSADVGGAGLLHFQVRRCVTLVKGKPFLCMEPSVTFDIYAFKVGSVMHFDVDLTVARVVFKRMLVQSADAVLSSA